MDGQAKKMLLERDEKNPARGGLEGLLAPTAENYKKSLENLASGEGGLVITFFLNAKEYAFEVTETFEVIKPAALTRVPLTPDFIMGILSVRGEMVPVIDIKKRLGLEGAEDSGTQRILIAGDEGAKAGFQVDRIGSVRGFENRSFSPQRTGRFIKGILSLENSTIRVLDIEKLLKV